MNAQSNHSINDTTDPLFLGPEAGQLAEGKAGGESQRKSELDANGLYVSGLTSAVESERR